MTAGTFSANTTAPIGATSSITGSATQFMTVDANLFGTVANPSTNNPSGPTTANGIKAAKLPASITKSPDATGNYGFHVAFATAAPAPGPSTSTTTAYPNFGAAPGCTFQLQVDVTGKGNFKAYQTWTGCANSTPIVCQSPSTWINNTTIQDPEFVTLDPRTLRFGAWANAAKQSLVATDYTTGLLTTLDQSVSPPSPPTLPGVFEKITALPPVGTRFGTPTSTDLYKYANNVDTTVHYTDPDSLQRKGDLLTTGITAMQPVDFADRPQIVGTLNRPFQSLAELGRVFRDQPWKTLDVFMTTAPPDAGLLDIFTLHESANEGGKTSLNTRQKPVLTAILSQVTKRLNGAGIINSTTDPSDLTNIVNAVVALQPMVRKTELLTGLAGTATVTGLGNKEAQESVVRAFSDACQTRTWNLLIDVIAQSGRYPPTASTLAGFLVEGEQHYWVHVAIDRFTGQVVDKQIEVVNE